MKHPYAEILHAIADGKRVQWHTSNGRWDEQEHIITLEEVATEDFSPMSYRIHPDDVEPVAEDSSVAGALAEAEAAFRRYAEHHATKGAEQKAAENAALACKMAAALAHRKTVHAAVDEAVKATREACAKECESRHANGNRKYTHADECAAGIRAMGDE